MLGVIIDLHARVRESLCTIVLEYSFFSLDIERKKIKNIENRQNLVYIFWKHCRNVFTKIVFQFSLRNKKISDILQNQLRRNHYDRGSHINEELDPGFY